MTAVVALQAIEQALRLLPKPMDTPQARVMMAACAYQESGFNHRAQVLDSGAKGPARGWWQFERGGGVRGVMRHQASRYWAHSLCLARGVEFDSLAIWNAIEVDDVLAAGFARLLLFTDPWRLPSLADVDGAWDLYERTWRPGKPHRHRWNANHERAIELVMGVTA